jgi:CubicO group peptidase (beta-lactamase class C family)
MMYSNFGYAIAGTMAEQAMNKPWEDLIREMLFEPLGMKSAGFGPPGVENEKNPSEPWGHQPGVVSLAPRSPGPGSDNPACMGPCGLVHLSLPDWSRYGLFHMGELNPPTPLLKPETLAKLHTDEFKQDYGFGWAIARPAWAKGPLFSHAGSNGLWFAVIHLAPERHFELLVATNAASEGAQKACSEAAKMLREQFVPDEK